LTADGVITEFFSDALTPQDETRFSHQIGDPRGQQTWECLAVWMAMLIWRAQWQQNRARLEVRSDSVAALTLLLKMKADGAGPAIIAREVALLLAEAPFVPTVCSHTPGLANVVADALSRASAPGPAEWPPQLASARRVELPPRAAQLFRAAGRPPGRGSKLAARTQDFVDDVTTLEE